MARKTRINADSPVTLDGGNTGEVFAEDLGTPEPEQELIVKNTAVGAVSELVAAVPVQRVTRGGDYVLGPDGILVKTR